MPPPAFSASLTEKAAAVQFHTSQWDAGASEWVKLTPPVCNSHKALSQHRVWVRSCPASPPSSWLHVNPRGDVLSGKENTCESWIWGDRGSGNTAEDATVSLFLSWPLEIKPGEGADRTCVVSVAPLRNTSFLLLPLQTLATTLSLKPTVHLKVITFKIAFPKQQTALVHPSP